MRRLVTALLCVSACGFVVRRAPLRVAPVLRRAETTDSLERELAIVDEPEPPSAVVATPPPSPAPGEAAAAPVAPYALLLLVTALWGSQHAVIRWAVADEQLGPAAVNAGRFAIAALLCSPWTPRARERETWRWGAELGFWSFLGFALQAVGLETTSATRSAFLLYLNVKLVPLFAAFGGAPVAPITWASAATALAGTYLLATDDQSLATIGAPALDVGGATSSAIVEGDLWSVAAAAASALFILRLESATRAAPSAAALTSASAWTTAALCAVWWLAFSDVEPAQLPSWSGAWLAALYLGAVPTALCTYLQTLAQRDIPAQVAAVIYTTDPLWAALFANAFLGERVGSGGLAGGALIAGAAVAQRLALAPSPDEKRDPAAR